MKHLVVLAPYPAQLILRPAARRRGNDFEVARAVDAAPIVEQLKSARNQKVSFERSAKYNHSEDLIPDDVHPDWRKLYEESWKLPELRGHADVWWKGRVREMVKREFDRMRKNPTYNPALWQELAKATDGGSEPAKWRALEKYCINKMKQIAGEAAPSP